MSERTRNRKSYKEALRVARNRTTDAGFKKKMLKFYEPGTRPYKETLLQSTPGEKQKAERLLRRTQKNAAKRYMTKVTAEKAAKAAKIAKAAKVAKATPVGIIAGVALDKGSEFARKKFIEADNQKVKKLKRESEDLDKKMETLRRRNIK
tara:strand:+ start:266 stop:715 length:450 start_codon:yes stop_codon:yes gene_type:complete